MTRMQDEQKIEEKKKTELENWAPKTEIGKKVKLGEITSIESVLDSGKKILEVEIIDTLLKDLQTDMVMMGQAKGKFGGGQRRVFKQTQKKTAEGNKPNFSLCIITGNKNGIVGIGLGKAKETVPAREKAQRNSKLGIFKIRRGCGSWQCGCKEPHSIPYAIYGKSGSVKLWILPAPKGSGLKVQSEVRKMLELAGIKDAWSKSLGHTNTTINLVKAAEIALRKLVSTKVKKESAEAIGLQEGIIA